jgi:WD40 repeat protein/class 3 adenylate cyclase
VPETEPGAILTFLIADVRGYTRFTQERGDEAAARLATRFAEVARERVEAAGGSMIELRGDEALAVFDSARSAIRAAIELQDHFVDQTVADPTLPLAVGIGLDAGEAVRVDGGYRGGALNLAARLCSLAEPGEVLASREVAHLARKVDGVKYLERGSIRLKGLADPVPVITVRPEPEDQSRELAFRRALGGVGTAVDGKLGTRNPYKGLRAFEEADAADFFGREALTQHLVERLVQTRFLAVVGPSGSGKSSVVRAGLVPALRRGALPGSEAWRFAQMFPGAYPFEELEAALLRVSDNGRESLIEQLEEGERGLLRVLKHVLPDDGSELVLVLDQLEEVFTLVEGDEVRKRFLAILGRAVADPHSRLRVVTTLRADFYDRPLLYSGFAELLRDYVEALVPLTPDEFERAIATPAERVGLTLEQGLLSEMIADVANEPGALPLLQYTLSELYERREGNVLTRDAYRAVGGVSGALAGRAEQLYAELSEPARAAARQLFLRLITLGEGVEDTRRRVDREELATMEVDQEALEEAIDAFGASRLLSFDRDPRTGTPTVEVAHEALLREWGRLRGWIDAAREQIRIHRRLTTAAHDWQESNHDSSFLLRGSHLAQFDSLADEAEIALTGLEREFVTASRAAGRSEILRQQRENRRLKMLLAGVGVLLLLAVVAGVVALVQRRSARHEATVALGRQLGAEAVIEPRIDRAMLLAHEAVNLDRSAQTEGTLLATLLRSPAAIATFTLPVETRPCCSMGLSPDGRTLEVPDNTSHTRFIDTTTRRPSKVLSNFGYGVAPSYSPDGSLVVGYGGVKAPEVDVLDARTYRLRRKLSYDRRWLSNRTGGGNAFLVTRDNHTVYYVYDVLVGSNGSEGPAYIDRWDLRTGKLVATVPVGAAGARDAVFVDGQRQIAVAGTHRVTFLQTATLKKVRSVPLPVSTAGSFALGPGARTAALGSDVGSVSFVDVTSGHVTRGLGGHAAPVVGVRFSPDGRRLVTTAEDGSVIVWDSKTAQPVERLNGHASRTLGISFSRDGRTLYTSSLDGAVFEWDLGTTRRFGVPFTTFTSPPKLGPDVQNTQQLPPLAVSPDGSRFAVRVEAGKVALYSASTLRRVSVIQPHMPEVIGMAWSSHGVLALTGDSGAVRLWDVGGQPRFVGALRGLRSTNGQPEVVTEAAFSPDGKLLAAGDINHTPGNTPYRFGTVAVWDVAGRRLLWKTTTKNWISTVAFAPDGKTVAAGREDGSVMLYDARTGKAGRELHVDGGGPETSAFAPDGTLATGNWAGIIQLWNPRTGKQVGHPTLVHAAPVASISFDPLGTRFATAGGSDGLAKLWATNTLQQLGSAFPGERGQWGNAQFTPDGSKLIVVFQNGKASAWPVTLAAWEAHACTVAGRNLTREEWSRYVSGRKYTAVCPGLPH